MKILAVCGMGFGSSMVLRMTIESVLKEMGIKANVTTADVGTAKTEKADLIVTSAEFANLLKSKDTPIVTIKNYVDKNEMKAKLSVVLNH
ncbi:protein-Npi-phosphohistidine-sugar phosphotransferase [Acididesulfobacillus acetoxydans]|uniref:PTS system, Lactose/Cellobiose specific IIB subunit n=1 Tax=Acididesulfobacillus acetoxydans TaxID=1561005 RepID=A0A8S0XD12_9FIRM|nr:PTS sugar transporter subunit IIB [Acididesulfobacillus acetoxydans]CAA7603016.1 protein-Npi-phosphohistidine-sugar phosphotransferase [Acididesulfobacillus acetoxydans]CEJ08612.1 PTS system, Lactose/Cellobiose specific IIB subunit [Acididesulfobacillus acetoxydans]